MKSKKRSLDRRGFLKSAATVGAAAIVAPAVSVNAQQVQQAEPRRGTAPVLSASARAAETEAAPPTLDVLTAERGGADFMVDTLKTLGFEYIAANPGSSFRGLQESFINYGGNKSPEWLTCLHEESSVGVADGYAKVTGKPMLVMAHSTVGLQHAAMNVYNAFCGRVPVFLVIGNSLDVPERRPGVEWHHSVQDAALIVRDYTKWDDTPISLQHFAESAVRAYKIAVTPPMAPVVLVADSHLQESPISKDARFRIPKLNITKPPQGDPGAVAETARMLVAAENPVLVAGSFARSQRGMDLMVELAETLQAAVISQDPRNMPSLHPLNQFGIGAIRNADVIVGLEVTDFWGTVNEYRDQLYHSSKPITKPDAKLVSISTGDFMTKSNYQDFQRYTEIDIPMEADAEATLPALIEACRRLITVDRKRVFEERGKKLAAAHDAAVERLRVEATYAWDVSPISRARLSAEVWNQIKNKDWALVGLRGRQGAWNINKHYQTIPGLGAAGLGIDIATAVGGSLAHRKYGRLCVNFQTDGDLMYAPGVLWTAAHHHIPFLSVVQNNRAYHTETMHLQRMALRYQRGIQDSNAGIGTRIENPNIDYAALARSMGLYGEGPITNPQDLGPTLKRAIEVVERGEPAVMDVVTQPS